MSALQIAFLDVGQGDTIIIHDPDSMEAVVVDCVNPIAVFEFLKSKKIRRLRALVLTHSHADHYLGAVELLDNCEWQDIIWDACIFQWDYSKMREVLRDDEGLLQDNDGHSGLVCGDKRRRSLYSELVMWATRPENKRKHIEPSERPLDVRLLGSLDFIHPKHWDWPELCATHSLNNLSYVIRVSDGTSALLTGDIEPEGWKFLRNNHQESLTNSVLKFPHHGVWRNGDVAQMLDEVNPQIVVISVGTANTYGHPATEVFTEISKRNIRLLCTQATRQCNKRIKDTCGKILGVMKNEGAFPLSRIDSGCPCAGTVIIELGKAARIVSPTTKLHINQIIKPYMKDHRCAV